MKRKQNQIKILNLFGVKFLDCDYNEDEFLSKVQNLQNEPEGGARCSVCFYLRLEKTASLALEKEFEFFGTTLTISPHKNEQIINNIGMQIEQKIGIRFLVADFKKQNGYLNSINLSKKYDLYRQDYCGCRFSMH